MKTMMRLVAMAAAVAAAPAFAQDFDDDIDIADDAVAVLDEDGGEPAEAEADDGGEGAEAAKPGETGGKKLPSRFFDALPFCRKLSGSAEVLRPGDSSWTPVELDRYYPLGSSFRTTDSESTVRIQFGPRAQKEDEESWVEISSSAASFGTRLQLLEDKARTITLQSGVITVNLPRNLPAGLFKISTPGFTVLNLAGQSRYGYTRTGDGEAALIRCVTGSLSVEGRHFKFPTLKAADEIKIRSSQDQLFTGLYGSRGDCVAELDQGVKLVKDLATGEESTEEKPLAWKLSPKTAVRIHRAMPAIGERMSVTVMTFDTRGLLKNRCAFTEGRPEVNTGELGPSAVTVDRAALAKRVSAAAADVTSVDIDVSDMEDDSGAGDADGGEDASGSADVDDAGDDDLGF